LAYVVWLAKDAMALLAPPSISQRLMLTSDTELQTTSNSTDEADTDAEFDRVIEETLDENDNGRMPLLSESDRRYIQLFWRPQTR